MTPLLFQPGMLFAQAVGQISYLLAQEVELHSDGGGKAIAKPTYTV